MSVRKFKVVTTWTVEVDEAEIAAVEQSTGRQADPKKMAAFKAIQRTTEVLVGLNTWDDVVRIHFDVDEIVN